MTIANILQFDSFTDLSTSLVGSYYSRAILYLGLITKQQGGMSLQETKKKKYKKVVKKEPQLDISQSGIEGSFASANISDPDISSIRSENGSNNSHLLSSTGNSIIPEHLKQEVKAKEVVNLHHDGDYADLKGQFEDRDELKSLKKYIKKAFPAKNIELFSGTKAPILKFQYNDISRDGQIRIRSLSDLIKANKELGERQFETILKIFDQIYCRISEKDKKVVLFLEKLAEKKRIELTIVSTRRQKPMLYYEYDDKVINFTLFDIEMRMFEFNSRIVDELKFEEKEFNIWVNFIKNIENKRPDHQKIKQFDAMGQVEVQSDEEYHKISPTDIKQINKRLDELITTDLTCEREDLQDLQAQQNALLERNNDDEKPELERVADQVCQLHNNITNFEDAVAYVKDKLKNKPSPFQLKNLMKTLIIAKKQLRSNLPITSRKQEIFRLLDKKDLIILEGETGSGKSTQLPQMMCQYLHMFDEGSKVLPVLITQPRRLATRTVAERVAFEMEEKIGDFVDYATSAHKKLASSAKIVFKLDSIVLDELTVDRRLSNYSCLIIDEAHERTISIDVILGLIKELQQIRKGFKVIVTSASLDGKLFEQYFKEKVFKVSGRLFPVDIIYAPLNQESDMVRKIEKVIKNDILISNSQLKDQYKGDVLVFCTGVDDINFLCSIFQKYLNPRVFRVFPLHGKIAVGQQRQVFFQTKEYKFIFATRIAQTSITINGVKVVVDPGVDRELVYDQKYRVSSRKLINISQSSAKQRAGRAGRTSSGFCFRLYSSKQFDHFRVNKTPEIDNMALDTLVLRLKSLKVDNIYTFPYVKVPDRKALEQSVQTLQMIGGLSQQENITTVGKLLLKLQVEPFLGRSIVEAIMCEYIVRNTTFVTKDPYFNSWPKGDVEYLRSVKTYVIQILCMVINSSNLFYGNVNLRDRIEMIKYQKFSNARGDFNYLSNIYSEFFNRLKKDKHSLENWFKSNYLTKKTLFQVKELVEEIQQIIKNFTLDTKDPAIIYLIDTIKVKLKYCKNLDEAILACMVTSFSVNLALYSNNPKVGYTLVLQRKPISIYGSSTLSQQGLTPKWIVCYDLKTNDKGITYCTIAHEVSFDFLKLTVENYVYKRLNLKEAEKMNPFYEQMERPLPSAVLAEIKKDYLAHESHTYPLLHHITLDFEETNNTLIIFYSKELKPKDISQEMEALGLQIYELVQNYILEKTLAKKNGKFITNVVSNIFAEFTDGYMVKDINFADLEVQFIVKGDKYILGAVRSSLDGIHSYPFGQMLKIITYGESDADIVRKVLEDYGLTYTHQQREKKEETLNGLIYMRFYTGRLKGKEPLFIYYGGKKGADKCREQHAILLEFQAKEKKAPENCPPEILKHIKILCSSEFKISFNSTGIKCFNKDVDAFELRQAFENLMITGILPFNFQKPYSIKEFRQYPSTAVQTRSQKQWEQQIQRVFEKYNLNYLTVKVKGEKTDDDDPRLNNAERMVNKELTAVITSKSLQTIDDMVRQLDNKPGVIGLGKIHFRHNYKQLITKVNKRTFKVLMDNYNHIKKLYEYQTNVKIEHYEKRFGKVISVFITCRSPIRQNLLYPTEQIRSLFYPFIKRLTVAQFRFLNNTDQGENQIEKIQQHLNYRVYFGFIKRTSQIKVYCLEHQFDLISTMLDDVFERNQVYVQNISYRGKGLAKVQEILDKVIRQNQDKLRKDRNSKLVLYYTINFKFREVQVYGDKESIENVKFQISKLDTVKLGSCGLCGKNVEQPFKLTYCQHQFCQKCLGDYINQVRKDDDKSVVSLNTSTTSANSVTNDNSPPLVCPQQNCGHKLNAADLQILLSTQQFERLSMERLKDFVKKQKQYIFCPTSGCEQIFEISKIQKCASFECVMCGRWFCSKCRQPHQYFDCTEWTKKLKNGQLLRFGYKECKCGYVIQKQNKDKLVRCKSCKEYLCWNCNKSWKVEKHCMQHIQTCKS